MRFAEIRPARESTARCEDMVFCGTASCLAISPAASPSGSWRTRRRKTSSRVGCAKAARARTVSSDSIYLELSIYIDEVNCLESARVRPVLENQKERGHDGMDVGQSDHPDNRRPGRI